MNTLIIIALVALLAAQLILLRYALIRYREARKAVAEVERDIRTRLRSPPITMPDLAASLAAAEQEALRACRVRFDLAPGLARGTGAIKPPDDSPIPLLRPTPPKP